MSNAAAATETASSATNNGKQIQKKLLNYARDLALEKLNKTLDKKLSKRRGANNDDDDDGGGENDDGDNNDGDGRVNTTTSEMATSKSSHHHRHHNNSRRQQHVSSSRRSTPLPAYRAHPDDEDNDDDNDDGDGHYEQRHNVVRRQRRPHPSHDAVPPPRHSHYQPPPAPHQQWVHPNHGVSRKGRRSRTTHGGDVSSDDDREAANDYNVVYDDDDDDDEDVTTELVEVSQRHGGSEMHRFSQRHPHQRSHRQRRSVPHIMYRPSERKSSSAGSGMTDPTSTAAKHSQKKAMAPQPPPTYAPLPRRRSGVPAFPVSNAHLVQPPLSASRDQRGHRSSSKRLNRIRKSYFDVEEADDDDEFHTASDDEDDSEDDEDDVKDYDDDQDSDSLSEQSLANDAAHMLPPIRRSGVPPKLHGASRSHGGSLRNSSTVERTSHRSSTNQHTPVDIRPKPTTRTRQASGHLVIDIPEYSVNRKNTNNPANDSENNDDTPNDGKPRTPVSSPGFNGQQGTSTADYSGYIQKKSLAQGMMDLALLSANINQMRYLLEYKDNQPYFATSFTLVITSLLLQIGVSLTLIWNIRFNVKKRNEMKEADRVNNIGVMGIFLVTVINVALSTFGGAPAPKEIHIGGLGGNNAMADMDGGASGENAILLVTEPVIYT